MNLSNIPTHWQLDLGGDVIATFEERALDFPWTYAQIENSPKFERFRTYFSDDECWPDTREFEDLCAEIQRRGKFKLRNLRSNTVYTGIMLNQEGNTVWFRYS